MTNEQALQESREHFRRLGQWDELLDQPIAAVLVSWGVSALPASAQAREAIDAGHAAGIERAAAWIDKRRNDYMDEHGSHDPETGGTDLSRAGQEYVGELDEIAEGLRSLLPCDRPPSGWYCTRQRGHARPCAALALPASAHGDEPSDAEIAEPVAWFAFGDSNGPVPLELYGWDEKSCKHAVLTYARAGNWKGTVEGYLLDQGWTLRPVYLGAPTPPAAVGGYPPLPSPAWRKGIIGTTEDAYCEHDMRAYVDADRAQRAALAAAPAVVVAQKTADVGRNADSASPVGHNDSVPGAPAAQAGAVPAAWWIPAAEQFCLAKKDGGRPFASAWQPLYAAPLQPAPAQPDAADAAHGPMTEAPALDSFYWLTQKNGGVPVRHFWEATKVEAEWLAEGRMFCTVAAALAAQAVAKGSDRG